MTDLLVYGSTPGGVACAVRAAREGLNVVMVTHAEHLGGLPSNGLSTMDALYAGPRAPIYDELREGICEHYRSKYGPESVPYRRCLPGDAKTKFEARVAEELITAMLARESRIRVIKLHYPVTVEKEGALLQKVTFQKMGGHETQTLSAHAFADCSYEGDLLAIAKVPYRVGREARSECNEEHAGRIFMRLVKWPPAHVDPAYLADYQKLNLIHYRRWFEIVQPYSTGEADPAVQGYNMRTVLTNDPANKVVIGKPADYDPEAIRARLKSGGVKWAEGPPGSRLPNRKSYWNVPELIGVQTAYVEGDWATRRRVTDEHVRFTLGLIYYLQNDPSYPEAARKKWLDWGLPRDEFADNGHVPYEIYMRETRRMVGRYVFTENDARLAPELKRTPVHADSIAITDWFMDSHPCTPEHAPGTMHEGEMLLNNITFPGQVPWRSMLPKEFENLVVPVCASCSHIGWGAIRLEPTWMSLAESSAWALVLAKRQGVQPAQVNSDELVRLLVDHGIMTAFFNDVDKHTKEPWYAAVQYLGNQGYFGSYDARPLEPLTRPLAEAWAKRAKGRPAQKDHFALAHAQAIWKAEKTAGPAVTGAEFASLLTRKGTVEGADTMLTPFGISPSASITRADAARLIYSATAPAP